MPHSFNLPSNLFLETHQSPDGVSYTTFLNPSAIQRVLIEAVGKENAAQVIKGNRAVITTCGSGMSAAILWLGLRLLNVEKVSLYDEVSDNIFETNRIVV